MIGAVALSGGPSTAGRVAGMPLALRAALLLQAAGCERVELWGVGAEAWRAALAADDRMRVPVTLGDGAGQGPRLTVSDRFVLDLAALRALLARPAALEREGELVAVHASTGEGEALRRRGEPSLDEGEWLCAPARDDAERRAATQALLQRLRKPQDGVVSRRLNRTLSLAVTARLCETSLRPNQLSVGILSFGAAAAVLAAQGTHATLALAGLLFQAQSVLDGCDGELARLSFRGSKRGEWIDTVGDDLTNYGYFAGASLGLHNAGLGVAPLVVGGVGLGVGLLASGIEYVYLARIGSGDLLKYPLGFGKDAGVTDEALSQQRGLRGLAGALRPMFKRDFFVFAAMLCAFAGMTATFVMLCAFAIGASVTLVAVLRSEWARRGVAPGDEP